MVRRHTEHDPSVAQLPQLAKRCAGHSRRLRLQNLLRLLRARHRIRMNPGRRMDLPSLAATANYPPWHFIRAFRDVFGEAPLEYANRIRLEHARDLLTSSRMTMSEIADRVGYDSRGAFCRSFRNAFDMTASQVRSISQDAVEHRRQKSRRASPSMRIGCGPRARVTAFPDAIGSDFRAALPSTGALDAHLDASAGMCGGRLADADHGRWRSRSPSCRHDNRLE